MQLLGLFLFLLALLAGLALESWWRHKKGDRIYYVILDTEGLVPGCVNKRYRHSTVHYCSMPGHFVYVTERRMPGMQTWKCLILGAGRRVEGNGGRMFVWGVKLVERVW